MYTRSPINWVNVNNAACSRSVCRLDQCTQQHPTHPYNKLSIDGIWCSVAVGFSEGLLCIWGLRKVWRSGWWPVHPTNSYQPTAWDIMSVLVQIHISSWSGKNLEGYLWLKELSTFTFTITSPPTPESNRFWNATCVHCTNSVYDIHELSCTSCLIDLGWQWKSRIQLPLIYARSRHHQDFVTGHTVPLSPFTNFSWRRHIWWV